MVLVLTAHKLVNRVTDQASIDGTVRENVYKDCGDFLYESSIALNQEQ